MNRNLLEYNPQLDVFDRDEIGQGEAGPVEREQADFKPGGRVGLDQAAQMALAARLLDIRSSQGLRGFLRGLAGQIGVTVNPAPLLGRLQQAAARILPMSGRLGQANAPARILGMELEGLSAEDQEFEVAKGFVRFAADAINNLGRGAVDADAAIIQAARRHAPGLLAQQAQSGRWYRQGTRIVVELPGAASTLRR